MRSRLLLPSLAVLVLLAGVGRAVPTPAAAGRPTSVRHERGARQAAHMMVDAHGNPVAGSNTEDAPQELPEQQQARDNTLAAVTATLPPPVQQQQQQQQQQQHGAAAVCKASDLLGHMFDSSKPEKLTNALIMALLASDAYPDNLMGSNVSNRDYDTKQYQAALHKRWAPLGALSVETIDPALPEAATSADDNTNSNGGDAPAAGGGRRQQAKEGHAVVVAAKAGVFVAFRGTSTPDGWGTNVRISPWQLMMGGGSGFHEAGGAIGAISALHIHGGFLQTFVPLYPEIAAAVGRAIETVAAASSGSSNSSEAATSPQVFFSGHSLGAAHAMLAALALSDSGATVGGVWTFAAPKVGFGDFVNAYMSRFGNRTFRWVNGRDLVPTLPPALPISIGGSLLGFAQLPAVETLWRTLDGRCFKADGPLLSDCLPAGPRQTKGKRVPGHALARAVAAAADLADEAAAAGRRRQLLKAVQTASAADSPGDDKQSGGGKQPHKARGGSVARGPPAAAAPTVNEFGPRCSFSIGDHRMFRAVGALGRCVVEDAIGKLDTCTARVVGAVLDKALEGEAW